MGHLFAIFMLIVLPQAPPPAAQAAPTPSAQAAKPPCVVSDDETYGLTKENAVPIGGGPMYVAAREQRYLNALRGPAGQTLRYKRAGSLPKSAADMTILDLYEVTYDGLEKPISLYLDAYHFWEQRAPMGFTCAGSVQLAPMMDSSQAMDSLRETGVEQGATRDFAPIPLGADGTTKHGVVYDGFRMLAVASRAAAASTKTLDFKAQHDVGTIVVSYPLTCEGKDVLPVSIDLVPAQGQQIPRVGDLAKNSAIAKWLPGVNTPPGSLAARFAPVEIRPTDRVGISYAESNCPDIRREVLLPFKFTPARPADFTPPPLPEGANPTEKRILLQVLIDLDGKLQRATYVGGPAHLRQPAIDAIKSWRAVSAMVNGAPVPSSTLLEVRFK